MQIEDVSSVWEQGVCSQYSYSWVDQNTAAPKEIDVNNKRIDDTTNVACIMIAIMPLDLQNSFED